ncbi:unknown protein [Seminavis robusta]|uniref:Uncharacterized protein n=1 Tax=Seminavis robusta TaxID=568900 RepID=A0A9N8F107_9STRA|nr:unknown protein [Seminavis robusta]|eukprot:Sro2441_g327730.1 n/a (126) ;mRNA; f:8483-8860
MPTLWEDCSQSRLWGGFHFTASVSAGQELCTGVGKKALAYETLIQNNSTLGSQFHTGDNSPQCGVDTNAIEKTQAGMPEAETHAQGGSAMDHVESDEMLPSTVLHVANTHFSLLFSGFLLAFAGL